MPRTIRNWALLATIALPVAIASAADADHCSSTDHRQLDFWLGDWDAFEWGELNHVIARTHVDLIAAGCAIHELYEQYDGLIGDSILSFDSARKAWQQTWVSNFGSLMVISGGFSGGALTLEGETHTGDGRSVLQRITWQQEGKGVRESSTMSRDGGKTWLPAFDVLFLRHQ